MSTQVQLQIHSYLIASKIIDECLLSRVLHEMSQKKYFYQSCWENVKNMEKQVMGVVGISCDLKSQKIREIDEVKVKRNNFKVKYVKSYEKDRKMRENKRSVCEPILKKQFRISYSNKLQRKHFHSASFHNSSKPNDTNVNNLYYLNRKPQQMQAQEKLVKKMRSPKINQINYINRVSVLNSNLQNRIQQIKLKKQLPITISHANPPIKKDPQKTIPHQSHSRTKLPSPHTKQSKPNTNPLSPTLPSNQPSNRQSLYSTTYQQIVSNQQQGKFISSLFDKIYKKQKEDMRDENQLNDPSSLFLDGKKEYNMEQFLRFKLKENRFGPSKAGVEVQMKFKNADWSTEKYKKNTSHSQIPINLTSISNPSTKISKPSNHHSQIFSSISQFPQSSKSRCYLPQPKLSLHIH